jgi:hypothetical protein
MTFTTALQLEYLDGQSWRVLQAFAYATCAGFLIVVPAGFETDFASVPRFFWRLLPPTGQYGKAAVIHDYLYRTVTEDFTKNECDRIFLEAMEYLGVGRPTRYAMYWGVRLFGRGPYQER